MMFVDIAAVSKNCIKIKGKHSSFVIEPNLQMPKTSADAVVFLNDNFSKESLSKVGEYRVVIKGPGEYEISGARVLGSTPPLAGSKSMGKLIYSFFIDGITVLVAKTSAINKNQETGNYQILLLEADSDFKESIISSFEPSVVVFYGENAKDAAKTLGIKGEALQKYSISADKIPSETQMVVLSQ